MSERVDCWLLYPPDTDPDIHIRGTVPIEQAIAECWASGTRPCSPYSSLLFTCVLNREAVRPIPPLHNVLRDFAGWYVHRSF